MFGTQAIQQLTPGSLTSALWVLNPGISHTFLLSHPGKGGDADTRRRDECSSTCCRNVSVPTVLVERIPTGPEMSSFSQSPGIFSSACFRKAQLFQISSVDGKESLLYFGCWQLGRRVDSCPKANSLLLTIRGQELLQTEGGGSM